MHRVIGDNETLHSAQGDNTNQNYADVGLLTNIAVGEKHQQRRINELLSCHSERSEESHKRKEF
jgi:hypothetical protein